MIVVINFYKYDQILKNNIYEFIKTNNYIDLNIYII